MAPTKGQPNKPPSIPASVRPAYDQIVRLTDSLCREHLNDEYQELCRKMAGVLARKCPSPLLSGKPESWACGIARVIAWSNYLGDTSQPHHMKMIDIDKALGVSASVGAAKSKAIRDLLKVLPINPDWTLPSRIDQIPIFRMF